MPASKRILFFVAGVIALTAALVIVVNGGLPERAQFTGQIQADGLVAAPELNAIAPSFTLPALDGSQVSLERLRGSTVIINFWATWCEPCRVEMPILQAFYESHRDRGLRVLAVNLGETPEAVRAWVDEFGLTFDMLLDPQQTVAALYQIRGQPSTYVVSPSGIITAIYYGPVSEEQLRAVVPE
jgi:peroxiredoxin